MKVGDVVHLNSGSVPLTVVAAQVARSPVTSPLQDVDPDTGRLLPGRFHYIECQKVDSSGRKIWEDEEAKERLEFFG